jgi:LacI family transcriptional regulator
MMIKQNSTNPTIRDVAKLAKVGLMTVSRVINNHPSVRPTTKKKVLNAIEQLGYQQNEAARLLKGQRAMMIGLIVPDLSDAFFSACAHTVQHIARMHGYMTLVVASERDAELEVEQAQLMANRKVSGLLIVTSTHKSDQRLRDLQDAGLAIVAFDRPIEGIDSDCVVVENRAGAEQVTQHLINHGHKHIACVGYDEDVYTIQERIAGYKNKMYSARLTPNVVAGTTSLEAIEKWVEDALRSANPPTAIFSLNHRTSGFLLQALSKFDVKIPDQMAIAGFDEFDLASLVTPPLTTISQSPVEIATRAMSLLVGRIQGMREGKLFTPAKVVLPVTLNVRGSCGMHAEVAMEKTGTA